MPWEFSVERNLFTQDIFSEQKTHWQRRREIFQSRAFKSKAVAGKPTGNAQRTATCAIQTTPVSAPETLSAACYILRKILPVTEWMNGWIKCYILTEKDKKI